MNVLDYVKTHEWAQNVIASGVLIVLLVLLRWVLVRWIRRGAVKSGELHRRSIVQIRNVCFTLAVFGLLLIWGRQLQTVAISLVAFTVAMVLATKELILCITGGLLRTTSGAFTIGDRIEVNKIRGDVIDITLLVTKIMEIGPGELTHQYTGRAIAIPNSIFLASPVTNESFTHDYVLHVFQVPMKADDDWQTAERDLLDAANEVCSPFLDEAKRHLELNAERKGLDVPDIDPRVTLELNDPSRVDLVVRMPAPARRKGRAEQQVIRQYLMRAAPAAPPVDGESPP